MVSWISDVKNAAFQIEAAGVTIIDEDVILALTEGLPESYSTFSVTLDSIPADDLTLDIIITCLLNEEVHQIQAAKSEIEWMEGREVLSSQDPHPIAEIPSDLRLIPYRSSNSIPTILQDSDTTLTKPPKPSNALLSLSELQMTSENPDHISVFICLYHSVLVLLNSEFVFMSSSKFSPFRFWYIKPFQYSRSLVLASALPSYISTSFLLNSSNSL